MSSAQLQSLKEVIDSQLQILKDAIDSQFDEQTKQQLTPAKPKTDVKNMLTTTMLMAPKTFARPNVVIEKQYQLVQQLRDELAEQSSRLEVAIKEMRGLERERERGEAS